MAQHQFPAFLQRDFRRLVAGFQKMLRVAEDPRVVHRRPADHHAGNRRLILAAGHSGAA